MHGRPIEDAALSTIQGLVENAINVTDLPLSAFQAATTTVCVSEDDCLDDEIGDAPLSDRFGLSWQVRKPSNFVVLKGLGGGGAALSVMSRENIVGRIILAYGPVATTVITRARNQSYRVQST